MPRALRAQILLLVGVAITLLILGIYHGFMQVLYRTGVLRASSFLGLSYYSGLTLHGVVNAIVFTTFLIVAFGQAVMQYYLKRTPSITWGWIAVFLMLFGTVLAAITVLTGKAEVLYTFYAPLYAHPLFYIGAALLIVGSWIPFFTWIPLIQRWRRETNAPLPLPVLGMMATFIVWLVATLAVAVEVLVFLIPWALRLTDQVNVPLTRTLFWFFGHPLVYFWLLPVYVMYYVFLPRMTGGKLFSENAARLVFMLFIVFSVPVGVHHQYTEPGLSTSVKWIHTALTFLVAVPSLITAFTVAASLEYAGWQKGYKSLFGWIRALPWFNADQYLVPYMTVGLLLFIIGGFTGVVNASYSLNLIVHNTSWIPGHFHLTVGGPVALGLLALALYLLETVGGKPISKKAALWVPYLWGVGMLCLSIPMMVKGVLYGEPRRTNLGLSYVNPESPFYKPELAGGAFAEITGGILLTIAAILFFYVFFKALFSAARKDADIQFEFPTVEAYHGFSGLRWLDRFTPWIIILLILIAIAYIPALIDVMQATYSGAYPYPPAMPVPIK